jgi:acyl CoA:acetate/3-ketoacid CoA transferase beta subunit
MAVFDVANGGLVLREHNSAFTLDEIREATEAAFSVASDLKSFS